MGLTVAIVIAWYAFVLFDLVNRGLLVKLPRLRRQTSLVRTIYVLRVILSAAGLCCRIVFAGLCWRTDSNDDLPSEARPPCLKLCSFLIVLIVMMRSLHLAMWPPARVSSVVNWIAAAATDCFILSLLPRLLMPIQRAEAVTREFARRSRSHTEDLQVLEFCARISHDFDQCLQLVHGHCSRSTAHASAALLAGYYLRSASVLLGFMLVAVDPSFGRSEKRTLPVLQRLAVGVTVPSLILRQMLAVGNQLRPRKSSASAGLYADDCSFEETLNLVVSRGLESQDVAQITAASEMEKHMQKLMATHPIAWYAKGIPVRKGKLVGGAAFTVFIPLLSKLGVAMLNTGRH